MANKKISELVETSVVGVDDVLPIVDVANTETKKIKVNNLTSAKVSKTGDTMTGTLTINPASGFAIEADEVYIGEPSWGPGSESSSVVSLKDGSTDDFYIQSADQLGSFIGNQSKLIAVTSGFTSNANSGMALVQSGDATNANSGETVVRSGVATVSGSSGTTSLHSGNSFADSGVARIFSGESWAGSTGNVLVYSSPATAGNSGSVYVFTGTATGVRGKIILDGSEIDCSAKKIINLADGEAAGEAVNKSQLDTKQNLPTSAEILAFDVDWETADIFYKDISSNSTFTFSNLVEAKGIAIILTNTSGSPVTVTLPSGIFKQAGSLTIAANSAAVYSLLRANSKTYLASITDLSNV